MRISKAEVIDEVWTALEHIHDGDFEPDRLQRALQREIQDVLNGGLSVSNMRAFRLAVELAYQIGQNNPGLRSTGS